VAPIALLLTARVTDAASPIDGVYRVQENSPTSQNVTAGACWATPMRTTLDPGTPAAKRSFYDVQITSSGNQVTFSQPGVSGALLIEPLAPAPNPNPGGPSNYAVRETRGVPATTSSTADYQWVDGKFTVRATGVDVDIIWLY